MMWEKMKAKACTMMASVVSLIALADIGTNSWWAIYQPEIPEELQE
ncbi:cyclic lactone autoinducer peptide [Aneurinibacillus danicus]|nr:cyclic lactone autoinducer peptide [Aneurinibacillus danicus]